MLKRNLLALLAAVLLPWPAGAVAQAVELLMVREDGCRYCAQWEREIGPIYPRTEESARAPLRRVDLQAAEEAGVAFAQRLVFTPTFVLVENGREVGRIEGYPGEEFFWGLLGQLLVRLEAKPVEEEK